MDGNPPEGFNHAFAKAKSTAEALLQSMIEEVEEYVGESNQSTQIRKRKKLKSNKVFIVHGHDTAVRESVARLMTNFGLTPVILHEQASMGGTIIEKLEENADVGFAIVILTADDIGGSKNDVPQSYKPRARQNVILELGYFMGHLGRQWVCALYENGVEIPSDYMGVVYIPLDKDGGWHLRLCRELKEAGLNVDLNKLVKVQK